MKKSVILLISIFFIMSLSILIMTNLKDTQDYVDKSSDKFNTTQNILISKNLKAEISNYFSKNKDVVNNFLDTKSNEYIPFKIKNIDMRFSLNLYDKVNLNDLNNKDKNIQKLTVQKLENLNFFNSDSLKYIIENKKIETSKQFEFVLEKYLKQTDDTALNEVKDLIGFLENSEEMYELNIKVNSNNSFAKNYYVLDSKGDVKYFEINIK